MNLERSFTVTHHYRLFTTEGVFDPDNTTLLTALEPKPGLSNRCLVLIDAGVLDSNPSLPRRIHAWFTSQEDAGVTLAASPVSVPGGEAAKDGLAVVETVARLCAEHHICRHSTVIAIGGGAALDAIGLGASLVHRGVRQVRLPTTVLAQDDAGLGIKNGVNAFGQKNFLGAFAIPHAVVNDLTFLDVLDDRQWRAGIAEAVKVAIIKDAEFLAWLIANAAAFPHRDRSVMRQMVERCAELHIDHITGAGDPFETGSSRPLDFGHWAAHRIEILSHHRLNHGEAVAIGLAIDCCYAAEIGRLDAQLVELILEALETVGFATWDDVLSLRDGDGQRSVIGGLEQFREHLGGQLTIAMPNGAGAREDVSEICPTTVESCIQTLRARHARKHAAL